MSRNREVVRTIETPRFRVEVFVEPEDTHPADSIAFGDDEAEAEYLEKINSGALPWVLIGVEVSAENGARWVKPPVLGRAYLGGCDFLPFDGDYGTTVARDLIREAIGDARATLAGAEPSTSTTATIAPATVRQGASLPV